jgi:MoaA/NifB/PqqE/SkfB family radical SAM enzyme
MTGQRLENLLREYDVLYLNKLKCFFESPINHLYKELATVNRASYNSNQRIVLVDTLAPDKNKQHFYNYFQKIITHLDITNCFILVITSDSDVGGYVESARIAYSQDQTCIQVEHMQLPIETVDNPTNYNIPDTICITPWVNSEITVLGMVTPCCVYDRNLEFKSITEFPLEDIVNGHDQAELRQQFLQGERPAGCQDCWRDEDHGNFSKRLRDRHVFRKNLFEIDYNDTGSNKLLSLDIKLKNTCNLSCRICSPELSTKWHSEFVQNYNSYPQWHLMEQNKSEWTDDTSSNFWTSVNNCSDIQYLTFAGGEPLLDKSHATMLKYFVDNNRSSEISLHYNTNGTIYANKLIPLWNQFKQIELSFSIDNVGPKFEYERFGAVWKEVVGNLKKYKKLYASNYILNVYSTVTILNILDSYDLYNFCKQLNLPIVFNVLTNLEELNIKNFTLPQKKYISNKIKNIQNDDFKKLIDPIVSIMIQQEATITQDKMINYLKVTDKIRNQDFKKTYSELSSILN